MDCHKETHFHVDGYPNLSKAEGPNTLVSERDGTADDVKDMMRMGKQQETQRNFRSVTILGFCMVVLSTWEATLSTSIFASGHGGPAGFIWGYFIAMVGFGFVVASLAEMASMAPTSGGQYHWVSEFAPPSCQRFLSYMVGWFGVLGWQTAAATVSYLTGKQIQAFLVFWTSSYRRQQWDGTLLVWAVLFVCLVFNTLFSKKLPFVEGGIVLLHIAGFFAVIVTAWVMGDRNDTGELLTLFRNDMGWASIPFSTMVGLTGAASCFVGIEAGAHMAEEVRNAAHVIPRAMMWTWIGNGLMGWVMAITFCFCISEPVPYVLAPLSSQQTFFSMDATRSAAGGVGLNCIMLAIGVFACIAVMATNSRQLFAFARDNGVPFSRVFRQVSPRLGVPLNSIYAAIVFVLPLSLINLGSDVALMQVISLGDAAMYSSYLVPISCVALKRIRGEPLLPSKFSLGRFGLAINLIAVLFLLFLWIFPFFLSAAHPSIADVNWAALGYGVLILFVLTCYVFHGRHVYVGPVDHVRKGQ